MRAFLAFTSFKSHAWRGSPFWHREPPLLARTCLFHPAASFHLQSGDSRVLISCRMPQEPPGWTTSPFPPTSAKLTHQAGTPTSWMTAKHPDQNFTFPSSPVRHSESWSPVGRRWEHSRPDNLAFSSPTLATLTRPTQWVLCPLWASARASQRDDLPLPPWQTRLTR